MCQGVNIQIAHLVLKFQHFQISWKFFPQNIYICGGHSKVVSRSMKIIFERAAIAERSYKRVGPTVRHFCSNEVW